MRPLLPILVLVALAGCSDPREAPVRAATWREDVAPLVNEKCVRCHGAADPAGSYALDSYLGALGKGSDEVPNAIAGDAGSLLLTKLQETEHRGYLGQGTAGQDALALITRWVVKDELGYFFSAVHPAGFLRPDGAEFHGQRVAELGWDMSSCRKCHGEDYAGGYFQKSCRDCHKSSPEACNTCHGAGGPADPPPSIRPGNAGAHAAHLTASAAFPALACDACHAVPAKIDSPGHLDTDGKADVTLGALASARGAAPTFDAATGTCAGVACHGAGLDGGQQTQRGWNDAPAALDCSSCHGAPPAKTASGADHPQIAQCELCHVATAGPGMTIKNASLHGNGYVEVLPGTDGCNACHSGPGGAPPFRDTKQRTDPSLASVGAHGAHLQAGFFAAGYTCVDCHAGRDRIDAEGHLDGSVQVAFGEKASARGNTPSFDSASGTCAGVACHGAGLDGASKDAPPPWTSGETPLCGDCHGLPPATVQGGAAHPAATTCGQCHSAVIDDRFQWVDPSLHADGKVEVDP